MATLTDIQNKVRQLTGRKSVVQLSNTELNFQINNYYQYEFPFQMRTLDLRDEYMFVTQPNVDTYDVSPNTFQSFEPPCYVAGYRALFVTDPSQFYALYPKIQPNVVLTTATGIAGPYSGTVSATPLMAGNVLVAANTAFGTRLAAMDNRNGLLYPVTSNVPDFTAASIGTVNYDTGAITITFPSIVPSGEDIQVQARQYNANRPTTIYWFDNQLILRPIPDQAYTVSIIAYYLPTALITGNPNALPDVNEWWEALAYGASMKIFENNGDLEGVAQMGELLERKINLISRREWFQLRSQRTPTIYASPTPSGWDQPFFGYYGGPY